MDKQRVAISRKVPEPLMSMLSKQFAADIHDSTDPMPPEKLTAFVRGAHAIVSIADDKITGEVCDAAGPAREAMGRLVAESVTAALSGLTPPNLVEGT